MNICGPFYDVACLGKTSVGIPPDYHSSGMGYLYIITGIISLGRLSVDLFATIRDICRQIQRACVTA
ncbi:hypothetical protein BDV25DRAFT_164588 [Aspergillus avenaceus]|uniref:Uncharacterized protein n=1 Tax=Aspergillus avenaceus TaxID=36643 RepID=A0A5N6TGM2_ASPAV|nr:hypothetical protein BDV25DRAFT_164588 [Aspergillus avenaceus]